MGASTGTTGRLWPIFIGGFLGPFGGQLTTTMLPELARDFDTTVEATSITITAYLVPFALFMVVSGTIAERVGRRRTVRAAFILYAATSIACALAPNLEFFTAARALQGVGNAFITPVLAAAITEAVPPSQLGGALGMLGSVQAAGQALAPLAGGLAAAVRWEIAFLVVAVSASVLVFLPPPDSTQEFTGSTADRWKALANRQLVLAAFLAMLSFLVSMGLMLLTALYARDVLGVGPTAAGLMVAAFGIAGLASGRAGGRLMDRFGRVPVGAAGFLLLAMGPVLVAATAGLPRGLGITVAVFGVALAGVSVTTARALTQTLAVTSAPTNRSGASSIALACQFTGSSLAPVVFMPVYSAGLPGLALLLVGVPGVLGALILAVVWLRTGRAATP